MRTSISLYAEYIEKLNAVYKANPDVRKLYPLYLWDVLPKPNVSRCRQERQAQPVSLLYEEVPWFSYWQAIPDKASLRGLLLSERAKIFRLPETSSRVILRSA